MRSNLPTPPQPLPRTPPPPPPPGPGFKLSSLNKLKSTKGQDGRGLLEYIVNFTQEKNAEVGWGARGGGGHTGKGGMVAA